MNKKIRILGIFLYFTVAFSFVSCNDYLDVTLLDQLTQDETFSKRVSTEQYLAHVYSYLPREYEYLEEGSGPWSSMGLPVASMMRPRRNSPTGILRRFLVFRTKLPAETPLRFS